MEQKKLGKYEIKHELGRGAMGIVYMGHDPVIQRDVAIKTMNAEAFQDKEQQERFLREARSAGALQHPNIVTIYEMGIENDTPYIVMEYVEGNDLVALIRDEALTLPQKLEVMAQLCDALDFAHRKGIIHRDIKPANIRILPDYTVKIMDFGIAKKQDADFTRTGLVVGTLSYMSPEQVQGKPLDPRSDQFSAGVVFYQLMTGNKPFGGDNITNVVYQIISFKAEALNVTGAPTVLTKIIQKMMAPAPENRFPTCRAVSEALRQEVRALKGEDIEPTVVVSETPTVSEQLPPIPPPLPEAPPVSVPAAPRPTGSNTGMLIGIFSVLIILIAVAGGGVWWKFFRSPTPVNEHQVQAYRTGEPRVDMPVAGEPERAGGGTDEQDSGTLMSGEGSAGEAADSVQGGGATKTEQQASADANTPGKDQAVKSDLTDLPATDPATPQSGGTGSAGDKQLVTKEPAHTPRQDEQLPVKRRAPKKTTEETSVFKKEGSGRQVLAVDGILAPVQEELQEFQERLDRMTLQQRNAGAKREFNQGRFALGNRQNLKAAVHFWKSTHLNPRDPHAYAWLVTTLVNMKAYEEARRTIERASQNGVSISQMEDNIQFKTAYSKLQNH